MIVCLKPFTMRGVRYGPPARPDVYRAQLADATARLAALDAAWAERLAIAEAKSLFTQYGTTDLAQETAQHAAARDDLLSVIARLEAEVAREEQPVVQVMAKKDWETLPKHKQRNMVAARYVVQREGRKLQEA